MFSVMASGSTAINSHLFRLSVRPSFEHPFSIRFTSAATTSGVPPRVRSSKYPILLLLLLLLLFFLPEVDMIPQVVLLLLLLLLCPEDQASSSVVRNVPLKAT